MSKLVARRAFLTRSLALGTAAAVPWFSVRADEPVQPPQVRNPRATSGDRWQQPAWDELLTITVGPKDADLVGSTERALQAAVDYVARFGGGTVRVLPGEYRLRNAVYLASGVRILGSGADSVLIKEPSQQTRLSADSDWFDQEITLVDASAFKVGDGICLRTKNPHTGAQTIAKRTLVARSGNRFKLDRALRENFWLMGETTCTSLFPMLSGENVENLVFEDITLDGNKKENELLDGNYAGCIFLQDCAQVAMRGVTARNYHGDGISWQICHDVRVENCHSHDHTGLGLHPGSGSQRPIMRNNKLEGNDIGIFFCWGVKFGLAESNTCDGNRVGISIGHRDNNNLVTNNMVSNSKDVGLLFRPERGPAFTANHNRFERNTITNSGGETGIAVDVQGATASVVLERNVLKETRAPAQRTGIRLGKETSQIELVENRIEGFAVPTVDLRNA